MPHNIAKGVTRMSERSTKFPDYMAQEIAKCDNPDRHEKRYVGVARCPECEAEDGIRQRTGHIHFTPDYDFWGNERGLRSA
jgi:hypothetical protein